MLNVDKVKTKKRNYFMTTEEAKKLWQHSKRWGTKWQVIIGLALFRGLRISEIISMNIYDFQNSNFNKLNVILAKSHIQDEFPLLEEFNKLLKEYIIKNKHMMKDGWLFPFYSSNKEGHMTVRTAEALFSKMRKIIGEDHPEFLDKTDFKLKDGNKRNRYRIGFHSCRRWFETRLWEQYKDKMLIRDIMRYKDSKVVDVYIDPYEIWKNEHNILNDTFGEIFQDFNNVAKGQTKLNSFGDFT